MGDILRAVLKVAGTDDFVMKMRNTLGQTKLLPRPEDSRWAGIPRMPARSTLGQVQNARVKPG
jgi:hypothetical protein